MSPDQIGQGVVGIGLVLFAVHNTWTTAQTKREARVAATATEQVRTTLTTNNGGSHVKDSLDRIERRQEDHGDAIKSLTERVGRLERRPRLFPFL